MTNTAGPGFIKIYPEGSPTPIVSTLNYVAGQTIANAAIVSLGLTGQITVVAGVSGTDILIDTNGYFGGAVGEVGDITGVTAGLGLTGGGTSGALTLSASYAGTGGTFGSATTLARSDHNHFGAAWSGSGTNGLSLTNSSTTGRGLFSLASATSGATYGVFGQTNSTALDAAGIRGVDGTGAPAGATSYAPAGVRGESTSAYGLLGVSRFVGVRGDVLNTSGAALAEGRLGYAVGGTNYGMYAVGDIGATGIKSFVMPHPTDPSLVIRYVALEGPEAGTYFRGKASLEDRVAIIDVPESFRLVTDAESLSVQVTPFGRNASLWVEQLGLERIVIRGGRDVDFFYTVNGVRRDFRDFQPIAQSAEFMPAAADARMPEGLSPEIKRRLIANGTYNEDGSVNLETALRLGWIERWAEQVPPARR